MEYKIDFNWKKFTLLIMRKSSVYLILLSTILSLLIYYATPKEFTSSSAILAPNGGMSQGGNGLLSIASQFGYSFNQSNSDLVNPVVIKKITSNKKLSSNVLRRVVSIEGENKEIFNFLFPKKDLENLKDFESAVMLLNKNFITVYEDLEGSIVNIDVTTEYPKLSFEICTIVLQGTINKINSLYSEKSQDKLNFINNRVIEAELQLDKKELALQKFRENNSSINSPLLQTRLGKLLSDIEIKKAIYVSLRSEKEILSVDVFDNNNKIFILDEPSMPVNKSFPSLRYLIVIFVFLNFLLMLVPIWKNIIVTKIGH
jgi:uncharacterized protein involved in exopolysaccharide biosynthesis